MQGHETVLLRDAVDALMVTSGATIVDATLGTGGHAREIRARLGTSGTLIALDADHSAIEAARESLSAPNVHLLHCNFRDIDTAVQQVGVTSVDGILADLGWRMEQFSGSGKGFSFTRDEPLVMTYGDQAEYPFTAREIVNEWSEESIQNVLRGYGEERFSGRIARAIREARDAGEINSSLQLAEIVSSAVPGFYRRARIHPATRTFQALRIAVNDELEALREFIQKSVTLLAEDGRLAIITFHSIEDRIVKHTFRSLAAAGRGNILTKKPIRPSEDEIAKNPRARSAGLRIFQKHENAPENTIV